MEEVELIELSGGGIKAHVRGGRAADLEPLREIPDLRHVRLNGVRTTPSVLRLVAGLSQIAALTISGSRLTPAAFAILEALPPGTAVHVENHDHDDPAWIAFRRRRAIRAARLGPDGRREAAERYASGIAAINLRPYDPRRVDVYYGYAADDDIRLLRWLPKLETLQFHRAWGVTIAALRYLAGHPRLKKIDLNGCLFTAPLAPLARCAALESLDFFPDYGTTPGDIHTVGLDRMTGLRRLSGWPGEFTDRTLARIGKLSRLRHLSLPLGPIEGDDSLRHLASLRKLEFLSLGTPTPLSDNCLRHLAGLKRLRVLTWTVDVGNGDGFRHLARLTGLRYLTLNGRGVTDGGIANLTGLTGLRVVQVPRTEVTAVGAAALAAALPEVAVHRVGALTKSPRLVVRFRRRTSGGFASALLPTHWDQVSADSAPIELREDGFAPNGEEWSIYAACLEPAVIRMWTEDVPDRTTSEEYLADCARSDATGRMPKRFEVARGRARSAPTIGMYPQAGRSHLTGVAVRGGRAGAVRCEAPPGRFESFRRLFEFVAASLRVGDEALSEEEVIISATEVGLRPLRR